ncbi:MAG: beta-phosphoglucomutase [Bacteroidales bacterium]|nr:beta-phosphoglucomutase [Bacteroidales bacterium]
MIKGVIFDLDGVIVSTDEFHYQAWQQMADEEGIYFDRHINERLRGVSRMESLEIILERARKQYSEDQKTELATRKNNYYKVLLDTRLSPKDILPGVMKVLTDLKNSNIKIAIGSSSRNSPSILKHIDLEAFFDATADGNDIKKSKPDPEVFLIAAQRLGLEPDECVVVEDAEAGITAALNGGMKALAVGSAISDKRAHFAAKDLAEITIDQIINIS